MMKRRYALKMGNYTMPEEERLQMEIYFSGTTQFSKMRIERGFVEKPKIVAKALTDCIPPAPRKYFK